MSQSQSKSRIDIVRDIDHYEQNILIIITVSKIYSKYAGESVVGKKLFRLSTERTEVTPDLVTEFKSENQFWAIISDLNPHYQGTLNQDYVKKFTLIIIICNYFYYSLYYYYYPYNEQRICNRSASQIL